MLLDRQAQIQTAKNSQPLAIQVKRNTNVAENERQQAVTVAASQIGID